MHEIGNITGDNSGSVYIKDGKVQIKGSRTEVFLYFVFYFLFDFILDIFIFDICIFKI